MQVVRFFHKLSGKCLGRMHALVQRLLQLPRQALEIQRRTGAALLDQLVQQVPVNAVVVSFRRHTSPPPKGLSYGSQTQNSLQAPARQLLLLHRDNERENRHGRYDNFGVRFAPHMIRCVILNDFRHADTASVGINGASRRTAISQSPEA